MVYKMRLQPSRTRPKEVRRVPEPRMEKYQPGEAVRPVPEEQAESLRRGRILVQPEARGAERSLRYLQTTRDFEAKRKAPTPGDHSHTTNKPRALLCSRCNRGLGLFGDDPERLEAAARYLRQHAGEPNSHGHASKVAAMQSVLIRI